jgi:hypothetical protein
MNVAGKTVPSRTSRSTAADASAAPVASSAAARWRSSASIAAYGGGQFTTLKLERRVPKLKPQLAVARKGSLPWC